MKIQQLLIIFFFLYFNKIVAQVENNPCTAIPLDASGITIGKTPSADGASPNQNLPCGSSTSEDNPIWYTFCAPTTKFSIKLKTIACEQNSQVKGLQLTIWEGENCNSLSAIDCIQVELDSTGAITSSLSPGSRYWIQIDGLQEAVCNYSLSYDLFSNPITPSIILNTPDATCINTLNDYILQSNTNITDNITWQIADSSATYSITNNKTAATIAWKNKGINKFCVKYSTCNNTDTTICKTIEVKDTIKIAFDLTKKICETDAPFSVSSAEATKKLNFSNFDNLTPKSYLLFKNALGKNLQNNFLSNKGCFIDLTTNYEVINTSKDTIFLGVFKLASNDTVKIFDKVYFRNKDDSFIPYVISKNNGSSCDSTVAFFIQLVGINGQVSSQPSWLDCKVTEVVVHNLVQTYHGSGKWPNQYKFSYLLSNGDTSKNAIITKPGMYEVTTTYSFNLYYKNQTLPQSYSTTNNFTILDQTTLPKKPQFLYINNDPQDCARKLYYIDAIGDNISYKAKGGEIGVWDFERTVEWGKTPPYRICAYSSNTCGTDSTCYEFTQIVNDAYDFVILEKDSSFFYNPMSAINKANPNLVIPIIPSFTITKKSDFIEGINYKFKTNNTNCERELSIWLLTPSDSSKMLDTLLSLVSVQKIDENEKLALIHKFNQAWAAYKANLVTQSNIWLSNDVYCYPNPSSDRLFVETSEDLNGELILSNLLGQVIECQINSSIGTTVFDLQHLPKGVYILTLKTEQGNISRRVVKE